jgi:hypothetical protein
MLKKLAAMLIIFTYFHFLGHVSVKICQGDRANESMKDVTVAAAPVLEGTFVRSTRILQGTRQPHL